MGHTVFSTDETPDILHIINNPYGKPSLGQLNAALLRLYDPMYSNQPVEVMIQAIKEVQILLLLHTEDTTSLPDTALINYAMININETEIYSKAIARWNSKATTNCIVWENFFNQMIEEYEKLLAKVGGMTLSQEGYGTEFHTTEENNDNASLVEIIVEYAERETVAKIKMSKLVSHLSMTKMNRPPPPAAQQYYAPNMAYLTNAQPTMTPTPENVQFPPKQHLQFAPQQQKCPGQ